MMTLSIVCLNPCFNGIWSASYIPNAFQRTHPVLILVLMEYGLRVQIISTKDLKVFSS